MQVRDISIKKRLLIVNFMMVFVPVCLLGIIGAVIFVGLRFTGTEQKSELAMLWPEKGPALSIQFAVSSLRVKAEKRNAQKLKEMLEDCHILEAQGINTLVMKDGKVIYVTDKVDSEWLQATVRQKCGSSQSTMLWDDESFTFSYTSPRSGMTIMAAGNAPFLAKGSIPENNAKEMMELLLFTILGVSMAIIIFFGGYLSRILSRQILEPLETLRYAAAEIREGNLEVQLNVSTQDELGETCQAFDRMRHELKRARETKEKYEVNRKELIAGISHDLSTPLTSLKGYASGILDGIARTPEKQKHYTEMIYHTACSMEKLVESLFLFSKLDLGRVPFRLEKVDICLYFKDFIAESYDQMYERGLKLEFRGIEEQTIVGIDRLQFQRVVENLLENSLKYKKNDTVSVQIILSRQAENLKISFVDDGIGVTGKDLSRLFDSFYRTDPARANVANGSGLGLAIVKQIVAGLKGTIWAEQTPGGGLTICMLLPIVRGDKHEENIDCGR
ncbi:ATP-binding protein [Pectinatus haikarae]|uniref:ATP-binding protein n=1 Tax=Pectinatus haikarae TaxID=349096 RepID=UPI0018C77EA9|nr:ATP-binding protein [Pectinatus haikarae]